MASREIHPGSQDLDPVRVALARHLPPGVLVAAIDLAVRVIGLTRQHFNLVPSPRQVFRQITEALWSRAYFRRVVLGKNQDLHAITVPPIVGIAPPATE